jgi:hypothetical protein
MKKTTILSLIALAFIFVSCLTEVIIEFSAELNFELADNNQNKLQDVEIIMERIYEGTRTGITTQEFTNANGTLNLIIKEGNLVSRYHAEKPIMLSLQEKAIDSDHEFRCEFKKDGYITKDTTITIKNSQKLNFVIKMERVQ